MPAALREHMGMVVRAAWAPSPSGCAFCATQLIRDLEQAIADLNLSGKLAVRLKP